MNCPSRVDADLENDTHNQNPPQFAADLTTNSDLNHIANSRRLRDHKIDEEDPSSADRIPGEPDSSTNLGGSAETGPAGTSGKSSTNEKSKDRGDVVDVVDVEDAGPDHDAKKRFRFGGSGSGNPFRGFSTACSASLRHAREIGEQFGRFVGPGVLISCAYIDPGNYATDVAAGASYRYKLLFVILMANIFAIFLQSLCAKLGSVTGKTLPENIKEHLPPWLNYVLWFFNEAAIVATDIAEVIGFAIALNLLSERTVPLAAGCAISIVTVLLILFFYRPSGSMKAIRAFEGAVACLVFGVVVCFCIQLSQIKDTTAGEVFKGYLPSSALVQKQGLYQACGILGATVMPHSLFLGSGLVQPRLRDYDLRNGIIHPDDLYSTAEGESPKDTSDYLRYLPSLTAIRHCLPYSIAEIAVSLFTFALFVNSSILIVAGAALYGTPGADDADIFGIYDLLSSSIGKAAGIVFALALLLSGTSAGIVCTMAGQMVGEGQLNWKMKAWQRRLVTRVISIIPSIIIAGSVGQKGISTALVASQVTLSCLLPIVSAPLIYFTCRAKYMTVGAERVGPAEVGRMSARGSDGGVVIQGVSLKNHWITATVAAIIWGIITIMNVAAIVLLILGT